MGRPYTHPQSQASGSPPEKRVYVQILRSRRAAGADSRSANGLLALNTPRIPRLRGFSDVVVGFEVGAGVRVDGISFMVQYQPLFRPFISLVNSPFPWQRGINERVHNELRCWGG